MKKIFNAIWPYFYFYNIDVVNAKTGRVLTTFYKLANGTVNVLAALVTYAIFLFAWLGTLYTIVR